MVTGLVCSSLVIASCATGPSSPQGAAEVRNKLTALQNDPTLADRARIEIREADAAVRIAEQPLPNAETALGEHRVYMADRKVAIAEAKAVTRYTEDQRAWLSEERDEARLRARTREADNARDEASRARSAADAAQSSEKEAAAAAALQASEYQRQIDALKAEVTDRGVVLTLGDVLFSTGSAELRGGANSDLNKLVSFLNQYPKRRVQIEGHTDNVGSVEYNHGLSQRRADSVRYYLIEQGLSSQRLSAAGMGMDRPVASNDTGTGRQQNRRVEIIVEKPL
ncbi:OmpA family protein [Aestuariicella hydrocarbonica]|uniref:OmpA family protein n=2 Tax=Pseudomaricurvus hydrocarbonicus TaxID=1470433 RepID=A0A9E5JXN8_9GAMM|nr:OmpA family protein [Aestuariicella hydrocarbonica]